MGNTNTIILNMLAYVTLCLVLATAAAQTAAPSYPDVETALSRRPHYSMLLDLLRTSGLLNDLKGLSQMTLFAPTNQALSYMENDDYNALKNDVTTDEAYRASGGDNDKVLNSLDNSLPIRINVYKTLHTVAADGCNITEKNIHISNGYIQGISDFMQAPPGDVVDVINSYPELTTMAKLVAASGLESVLRADKNITVFCPTDEAFGNMDPAVLTYLQQNPDQLKEVLLFHVVQKTTLYRIGMRHAMTFPTADSHKDSLVLIESQDEPDDFFLNHALIADSDIGATNGVIHTIEDILIPSSVLVLLEDQGFGHLIGRK